MVLGKKQDQVRLMLAGDKHHYVRYARGADGERGADHLRRRRGVPLGTSLDKDGLVLPPGTLNADIVDPPAPSSLRLAGRLPHPARSHAGSRCGSSTGCRGATRGSSC